MATYKIDASHSDIEFKVKHLMITTVTGKFTSFEGSMETQGEDFNNAAIRFSADVNSISTNNEQRDGHLKSDDFFNATAFPVLAFQSSSFTKKDEENYTLTGNITIRDITKPITLEVNYGGEMVDPWGQQKIGFEIQGKLSRKEFDLKWTATTEAGGVVVSDEVKLNLAIQLVKQ
jgi:polyisoprenoid-binding protein YceI